jgi:hypothetical protein
VYEVLQALKAHGIDFADKTPRRTADTFVALVNLADTMAGEHLNAGPSRQRER